MKNTTALFFALFLNLLAYPCFAQMDIQAFRAAKAGGVRGDKTISKKNIVMISMDSTEINQIGGLHAFSRPPLENDKAQFSELKFCSCLVYAVLDESANRKTYFFRQEGKRNFTDAMLTVWAYTLDHASLGDPTNALMSVEAGGAYGSYLLGRASSSSASVGLLRLSMYQPSSAPRPMVVEIAMRLEDTSDENLNEVSSMVNSGVAKILSMPHRK